MEVTKETGNPPGKDPRRDYIFAFSIIMGYRMFRIGLREISSSCALLALFPCVAFSIDDMSLSKAVGIGSDRVRISGIHRDGESIVGDMIRKEDGRLILVEPITVSKAPRIANLSVDVVPDSPRCRSGFPDELAMTFDFSDRNADIAAGYVTLGFEYYTNGDSRPLYNVGDVILFPPSKWAAIAFKSKTAGRVTLYSCWLNVNKISINELQLFDGDSKKSNILSVKDVIIPASNANGSDSLGNTASGAGFSMK